MKIDRKQLFETMEPPPHGAARLRARLRAETRRPVMTPARLALAAIAASAVIAAAILFTQRTDVSDVDRKADSIFGSPAFDRLLGRESEPVALRVTLNDTPMTATAVASENPKVRVYELTRPD